MLSRSRFLLVLFLVYSLKGAGQSARHVILISIDGLRPEMYLDSSWPAPNLRYLMHRGTYADHMRSVFPAYTYPSHTAMLTGALPARSGVYFNQPKTGNGEWDWFATSIRVPTLWRVIRQAGMTTSAVQWPLSAMDTITYSIPEIFDIRHPEDRITLTRKYATPGLLDEIERNATGRLDSSTMTEEYFSIDDQSARMAGYIIETRKPAFLAIHLPSVDGKEHDEGPDGDSVRLALAASDHDIGLLLEAIRRSSAEDSTVIIVVGDHGMSAIHEAFRPNMLIRDIPAKFVAAGGSAFLYRAGPEPEEQLASEVAAALDKLPPEKRRLFRIIRRPELDQMGADSAAILALAAIPGLVFSGAVQPGATINNGPGSAIQQNPLEGVFYPVQGGHHGYDPNLPEMYTGFIAAGAGIAKGGHISDLCVTDIAPLVATLLGINFKVPDGKLVTGILANAARSLSVEDWPNLHRYREDNEMLQMETVPADRVVFMGNSITDFWIRRSPEFFSAHHFIDRGISAQTSPQMLLRFRQDVTNLRPAAVVIECGTNDIAGNKGPSTLEMIEDNIASMAELAKSSHIVPIIGSVLPADHFWWRPELQPANRIDSLNQWIRQYCIQKRLVYLNYYAALVNDKKGMDGRYSEDGVHPNEAGYRIMEAIALRGIKEALRK